MPFLQFPLGSLFYPFAIMFIGGFAVATLIAIPAVLYVWLDLGDQGARAAQPPAPARQQEEGAPGH